MAKIEKIGNTQVIDNKEDNFFYFPMISMACTGKRISGSYSVIMPLRLPRKTSGIMGELLSATMSLFAGRV